jgi:exodeoxyribonuclease VII large subunit
MLVANEQQSLFSEISSVSLSAFLGTISDLVKQHTQRTWVRAEISKLQERTHLFLELVEHDEDGREIAKCQARVWMNRKQAVLGKFSAGTGSSLEAGIKVLLLVEASFHPQYGFALTVNDIDPSYTLGDMAKKLIEIRQKLTAEGLYDRNKRLAAPQAYSRIAVISPENAAGLGDFRAQADKLAHAGLCRFDYFSATFQGASAPAAIAQALKKVAAIHEAAGGDGYDVIVVIRGGGAVTDLAWLNDYQLARILCCQPVPVFTGIGHQQDNTILDEVAHTRFDTPSKVIGYLSTFMLDQARAAIQAWQTINEETRRILDLAGKNLGIALEWLTSRMLARAGQARQCVETEMANIEARTREGIRFAGADIAARYNEMAMSARASTQMAHNQADSMQREIETLATGGAERARNALAAALQEIAAQAASRHKQAQAEIDVLHNNIFTQGKNHLAMARSEVEHRISEVLGLGPQQTLQRGYAIIRADRRVVTSAAMARAAGTLNIEFHDGQLDVTVQGESHE